MNFKEQKKKKTFKEVKIRKHKVELCDCKISHAYFSWTDLWIIAQG